MRCPGPGLTTFDALFPVHDDFVDSLKRRQQSWEISLLDLDFHISCRHRSEILHIHHIIKRDWFKDWPYDRAVGLLKEPGFALIFNELSAAAR